MLESRNPNSDLLNSGITHSAYSPFRKPSSSHLYEITMAKKRKLTKAGQTAGSQQEQQQKKVQKQKEEQQRLEEEHMEEEEEEEADYVEEEVEEEEEENDEEEDDEEEDEDEKTEKKTQAAGKYLNRVPDEDDEPIHKLLEPFSKEQLINLLSEAAESNSKISNRIRMIADEDPVHRKIFVHGLGWDTTGDTLREAFNQYGEIEDCKAVTDKVSGKSKGYGFILFKTRTGARKALKEPQKKIGNRMTACQLAAIGPVPASGASSAAAALHQPNFEYTQRKIYVSNVAADIDPRKLTSYFAKFGEIEEGPLGLDKATGKPKGFCLFVYKTAEGAKRSLEEPHKNFEGHILHCQRAIDGPKAAKQQNQQRNQPFGRNDNAHLGGPMGGSSAPGAGALMGQSVGGLPFNQGAQALNPALGQALTALLASQGAGLGLSNLLGGLGSAGFGASGVNPASHGIQGAYGNQGVGTAISPGVLGGYGSQGGLQSAYPNQQSGQGGSGRSQHGGHLGGMAPYSGH